jgi:hypothetical protein
MHIKSKIVREMNPHHKKNTLERLLVLLYNTKHMMQRVLESESVAVGFFVKYGLLVIIIVFQHTV